MKPIIMGAVVTAAAAIDLYAGAMALYTPSDGMAATAAVGDVDGIMSDIEDEVVEMDELVVSANRNLVRRCEAPVVVSVIGSKIFESVCPADLAQTLNYQSGLRVENNCQNCGFPQLRINGLDGAYSQILVNSRPVVSSLSGVYALEQLPVNMIERIEVVRGGGSALFGANAVGGTVNVITKEPFANRLEAATTVENHNGKSW